MSVGRLLVVPAPLRPAVAPYWQRRDLAGAEQNRVCDSRLRRHATIPACGGNAPGEKKFLAPVGWRFPCSSLGYRSTRRVTPMIVQPYLFFDGRCEEAVEFYRRALGAELTMLMRYKESPDAPPPGMVPPGSEHKVMHASLRI